MTKPGRLEIKNWSEFQHYHKRSPPWIKLHRALLDDSAYHDLPFVSQALAPKLWLLASETNGSIDARVKELAFRLRWSPSDIEDGLIPLIEQGFVAGTIVRASGAHATRQQSACLETETETEGETEAESERALRAPADVPADDKAFPSKQAVDVYRRHRPGSEPPPAMFKPLKRAVAKHGWAVVEPEFDAYLQLTPLEFENWPSKFVPGLGGWVSKLGGKGSRKESVGDRAMAGAAEFLNRRQA